jgi:cytochrome b involved in lipid metabolism
MKYVLIAVAVIAAGVIGYSVLDTKETSLERVTVPAPVVTDTEKTSNDMETGGSTSTPVATNPKPTVTTFTMAEVALHADTTSCYSVINGSVYDLTTWITKHPGGERGIKSICGKDGSDGFNGKHGGKPQPESTLASFKIGVLAQ